MRMCGLQVRAGAAAWAEAQLDDEVAAWVTQRVQDEVRVICSTVNTHTGCRDPSAECVTTAGRRGSEGCDEPSAC